MKVIYTRKNILIQEFQHSLESKLIEVMKMKILLSKFIVKPILPDASFGNIASQQNFFQSNRRWGCLQSQDELAMQGCSQRRQFGFDVSPDHC
jgi:hypothetical protein